MTTATILHILAGIVNNGGVSTANEHPAAADSCQTGNSGSEWVELFVREMTNASDMGDARARASRALEVLEKSIVERTGADAAQNLQKVHVCLSSLGCKKHRSVWSAIRHVENMHQCMI